MTLDEVRSKRPEIHDAAWRHGVESLRVVMPERSGELPYDFDLYVLVEFNRATKDRMGGLEYFDELGELEEELSSLLGCRVAVADRDGESSFSGFDAWAQETAELL